MTRPLHLVAVTIVFAAGLLHRVETAEIDWIAVGIGTFSLLLIASRIHVANEYADFETDALTIHTPFSGGSRVLPESDIPRSKVFHFAGLSSLFGFFIAGLGVRLGYLSDLSLAILLVGGILGWMYSLPPLSLAWNGLGELDNAIAGAMLLPSYGIFVSSQAIVASDVLAFKPFSLHSFLFLLATSSSDREADSASGKWTQASRIAPRKLRLLHKVIDFVLYP